MEAVGLIDIWISLFVCVCDILLLIRLHCMILLCREETVYG